MFLKKKSYKMCYRNHSLAMEFTLFESEPFSFHFNEKRKHITLCNLVLITFILLIHRSPCKKLPFVVHGRENFHTNSRPVLKKQKVLMGVNIQIIWNSYIFIRLIATELFFVWNIFKKCTHTHGQYKTTKQAPPV